MDLHSSKKGSTSVFLMMILASMIFAVSLFIYEASQLAGRNYTDAVLEMGGRSVLSEYDIHLNKRYGILAVHAEPVQTEEKIRYYANYSFHKNLIKEAGRGKTYLDPLKLSLKSIHVDFKGYSITNITIFEEQILDYMKYGIIKNSLLDKKIIPQKMEIELKNQQIINSLPSHGYSKNRLDIKKILEKGIPSLEEIKESGSDSFYINEYIMSHFLNHSRGSQTKNTFFLNEAEYLLKGHFNDQLNYKAVRSDLLIMRTGLNLTHIYSDSIKRNEVISLASVLTPGPEAVATQILIAGAWAAAEAENDLRRLEDGKEVPIIKTREHWALDLQGVIPENEKKGYVEPQNKKGYDYEAYLRILLFLENKELKLLRCMDLIQLNMKGNYYRGFDLKEYYGGFQFEAIVQERKYSFIQKY